MIELDSKKYKPHTDEELQWLKSMHKELSALIELDSIPVDYIRVGRQVKAYGSSGVRSYKVEIGRDGVGVWINGHHRANIDIPYVAKYLARSALTWKPLRQKITDQQQVFLKLKYQL